MSFTHDKASLSGRYHRSDFGRRRPDGVNLWRSCCGLPVVLECEELIFDARCSFSRFRHRQCFIQPRVSQVAGFKLHLRHEQRVTKQSIAASCQGTAHRRIELVQPNVDDVDQRAIIRLECLTHIEASKVVRAAHEPVAAIQEPQPWEER